MSVSRIAIGCLAAGLMSAASVFGGNTYFVSPAGNDSAAGTSLATAWRTVQKAALTANSGDIVRVRPGTYQEKVAPGRSGTSDLPVIFLADGTNVVVRGFDISRSYVWVIGFEITHLNNPGAYNYPALTISRATGVQILDCDIHHVDSAGIQFGNCDSLVFRGNKLSYIGYPQLPAYGRIALSAPYGGPNTNAVIEYNNISYTSDFLCPYGSKYVYRNNILGPSSPEIVDHVDGLQANGVCTDSLFEGNWFRDNVSSDNHFFLNQLAGSTRWIIRGNVTVRSKGGLDWRNADQHYFYNNTFYDNATYWPNSFQILLTASTGNIARNNIWYRSVTANSTTLYYIEPGSAIDKDYDLAYQSGTLSQAKGVTADPRFADPTRDDFALQATSPAIRGGGGITLANGGGTGSTALVARNAAVFWPGDTILVGAGPKVVITNVNVAANTLTLAEPRSWSNNAPIWWEGRQDIGAFNYRTNGYAYDLSISSPTGLVAAGSISLAANVANPEVVRMVEFRVDGLPVGLVTAAPYTTTFVTTNLGTRVLEARAYPRHASPVLWKSRNVAFSVGVYTPPAPPGNLRTVGN